MCTRLEVATSMQHSPCQRAAYSGATLTAWRRIVGRTVHSVPRPGMRPLCWLLVSSGFTTSHRPVFQGTESLFDILTYRKGRGMCHTAHALDQRRMGQGARTGQPPSRIHVHAYPSGAARSTLQTRVSNTSLAVMRLTTPTAWPAGGRPPLVFLCRHAYALSRSLIPVRSLSGLL